MLLKLMSEIPRQDQSCIRNGGKADGIFGRDIRLEAREHTLAKRMTLIK
jgi:hypothetical protein